MEKDYTVLVKVEWAHSVQAETKEEAIAIVKEIMYETNRILIEDNEIIEVEED